jgi:hypothetical protein
VYGALRALETLSQLVRRRLKSEVEAGLGDEVPEEAVWMGEPAGWGAETRECWLRQQAAPRNASRLTTTYKQVDAWRERV